MNYIIYLNVSIHHIDAIIAHINALVKCTVFSCLLFRNLPVTPTNSNPAHAKNMNGWNDVF
jgi:hypothetical protein